MIPCDVRLGDIEQSLMGVRASWDDHAQPSNDSWFYWKGVFNWSELGAQLRSVKKKQSNVKPWSFTSTGVWIGLFCICPDERAPGETHPVFISDFQWSSLVNFFIFTVSEWTVEPLNLSETGWLHLNTAVPIMVYKGKRGGSLRKTWGAAVAIM